MSWKVFDENGALQTAIATIPAHGHSGSSDGGTLNASAIAAGLLAAARGGLGADASAFDGLIKMAAGIASVATPGTDYVAGNEGIDDRVDALLTLAAGLAKNYDDAANLLTLYNTAAVCDGRLTLTSGTSVTINDVTGAGTLYFTPHTGEHVTLYDGTRPRMYTFSELSLSLSGYISGRPYDIFCYPNSGTPALEGLAWTDGSNRATALTRQNGMLVKSGDATRRLLGSIAMSATGQTEDSEKNRLVANLYNRERRLLRVFDTTDSWSYGTATWRSLNNSTTNRVQFMIAVTGIPVSLIHLFAGLTQTFFGGIALDATNTNHALPKSATGVTSAFNNGPSYYFGSPAAGLHYLQLTEKGNGTSATIFGDAGSGDIQLGGIGEIWA